jgi:hypothetical protein
MTFGLALFALYGGDSYQLSPGADTNEQISAAGAEFTHVMLAFVIWAVSFLALLIVGALTAPRQQKP